LISKLQKKIIAINVISVCIVFFVALAFIFAIGYSRVDEERNKRISAAFDFDFVNDDFSDNVRFNDIALLVFDKNSKQIVHFGMGKNASLDRRLLEENINRIAESDDADGWISLRIRYVKQTEGDMVKIVFNNRFSRANSMTPYLISALGALVIGIGCYLIISVMLAGVALKPVEESWKKQKQFVADASHELKTPLSVIMANTEIIASHKDDTVESQMKWIENTQAEAKRMAGLVADLLFLAKNDDGLQVQMENVNMSECLENTVLSYDAVFYENGKNFRYEISPEVYVMGNAGQLKQLATILLDNANRYSLGKGNINLRLCAGSRHATLTVSNDSEELSNEQLAHLFDRFYTIDKSRNTDKGGNGLGLSIARAICQSHEGGIDADFCDGRTTFTVTLPVKKNKQN